MFSSPQGFAQSIFRRMSPRSSIPGCGVTFEIVSNIPEVREKTRVSQIGQEPLNFVLFPSHSERAGSCCCQHKLWFVKDGACSFTRCDFSKQPLSYQCHCVFCWASIYLLRSLRRGSLKREEREKEGGKMGRWSACCGEHENLWKKKNNKVAFSQ